MKFRIKVREVSTSSEWLEEYERTTVTSQYSAKQAANNIIQMFNASPSRGKYKLEVMAVKLLREEATV